MGSNIRFSSLNILVTADIDQFYLLRYCKIQTNIFPKEIYNLTKLSNLTSENAMISTNVKNLTNLQFLTIYCGLGDFCVLDTLTTMSSKLNFAYGYFYGNHELINFSTLKDISIKSFYNYRFAFERWKA